MNYELLADTPEMLVFATDSRTQRGRGVLYATTPFVVYLLAIAFLFFLATTDLSLWTRVKEAARMGMVIAFGLALVCFMVGYRVRDFLEVTRAGVKVWKRPALGPEKKTFLDRTKLTSLALDPSLRSLGADVLLVAVTSDSQRVSLAEGDPHSGQIHSFAAKMAKVLSLPVEAPKFTSPAQS